MPKPLVIDLFAGMGGMALGLKNAGFELVVSVEQDSDAVDTHGGLLGKPCRLGDARDLLKFEPEGPVALVAGGPPCQPFSRTGKRRGLDDVRGNLSLVVPETAHAVGARAFLFENVPAFARSPAWELFEDGIPSIFTYATAKLDAADYGVGQHRERLFVVGFSEPKAAKRFRWPAPLGRRVTADEVVGNGYLHPAPTLTANEHNASRRFGSKGAKTAPRHSGDRMGGRLSLRECLLLQGFDPNTEVFGNVESQHRQVGNAVPPGLAEAVGRSILFALEY